MVSIEIPEMPECKLPRLSNESVLTISLFMFLAFAIAELVGSLMSGSLSLLGDSICMFVDVSTYFCNIYVEWFKSHHGRVTFGSRITTEVAIPSVSVLSLIAVSIYIIYDGTSLLRSPPSHNTVNVDYLYSFTTINLLIDIVSSVLFLCKGPETFHELGTIPKLSLDTTFNAEDEFGMLSDANDDLFILNNTNTDSTPENVSTCSCQRVYSCFIKKSEKYNLNMLTAFVHILGDLFRTIATFLAALISTLTNIDGDICDAYAAILVSVTIIMMCIPLIREIQHALLDIWDEDVGSFSSDARSYKIISVSTASSTPHHNNTASSNSGNKGGYQRVISEELDGNNNIIV